MNLFRWAVLIFGCISLFSEEVIPFYYEERLVQEGIPYEMNCTGKISLQDWEIHWLFTNDTNLAICKHSTAGNKCYNGNHMNNVATVEEVDRHITSLLTISKVSRIHRGLIITCKAFEFKGSGQEKLGVWNMSRTYYPPRAPPLCHAHLNDGQKIHLSCQATMVYPGIICETFQYFNGQETRIDTNMMYQKRELDQGYYNINCSVVIVPVRAGDYTFCVVTTSDIAFEQPDIKMPVCTQNITIQAIPTMRIINNANDLAVCPGKQAFLMAKCQLLWWNNLSTPIFSWYLDDKQIDTTNIGQVGFSNDTIESIYNFIPDYNIHKKLLLKCQVSETVYATTEINLMWPSTKPPEFAYISPKKLNQTIFGVVKGEKIKTECAAQEGSPPATNVTVKCLASGMTEVTRSNGTSKAVLDFTFHKNTYCSCTAQYNSQCVTSPANITFLEAISSDHSFDESLIYLISAMFIGLVGLGAFIVLILYWRTKCQERNTCGKFELRKRASLNSSKTNRSNKEEEPYSVVDIVDQINEDNSRNTFFIQPSSNWYQDNVHSLSNHLPISKRPLPALPHSFSSDYSTIEDRSELNVTDSTSEDIYLMNIMKANDEEKESLPLKEAPPLPPKTMLNENKRHESDISVYTKNNIVNVNTHRKKSKLVTNYHTDVNKTPKTSYLTLSLSRRPPPPIPCGHKSNVTNLMTNAEHEFCVTCDAPETSIGRSKDDQSVVSMSRTSCQLRSEQLSNDWPPPPFKDRKKTTGKRKSGNSHIETLSILPNHTELEKDAVKKIDLENKNNLYCNVNTILLSQDDHSKQTDNLLYQNLNTENVNDREIDECSERSMLTRGLSSSNTSVSTVISVNYTNVGSDVDDGIL